MARSEAGPAEEPRAALTRPISADVYRFLPIFRTFLGDFNPRKLPSGSLRTLFEWKNRIHLDEYFTFNLAIPPEDESEKKTVVM